MITSSVYFKRLMHCQREARLLRPHVSTCIASLLIYLVGMEFICRVFFIPQTVDSIPVLQQAISIQQRLIAMQVIIVGSCDLMCLHGDFVGYGY